MQMNPELVLTILGVSFLVLILVEFGISKWKNKGYYTDHYLFINLSLASLQQISGLLYQLVFLSGYVFVQTNWSVQQLWGVPKLASGWPFDFDGGLNIHWPVLTNWILVLILADFCQYWLHRFSHEVNILWAGHIVHHSNTEYNYGVAVRQSFIEGFYTWIFYLPLAFAGIPWELFISAYALSLFWQFFVHTRFVDRMGILEWFMATPSHHRAHHGKNERYLDKNYGALFIIWDRLFGTFELETEPVEYGITVPLEHNNLMYINTHQHLHIFRMLRLAKGWKEKLKVFFGRPSYVPGGQQLNYPKVMDYHFVQQRGKQWYVYLSFLFTSLAGMYWMNEVRGNFFWLEIIAVIIVLGGNLVILTGLLEDKYWANAAEVTKLCLALGVGTIAVFHKGLFLPGILMMFYAALFLLATWWLAADYKKMEPAKV
jgi:sterol desaturase/sphingolipid hydroxylase (fatty acid hydroxylase superfamily)